MAFRIDLEGRLAKIRLGSANSLQALFEAVANAAEAVESNGRVTIRVLRDESSPVMQTRTEAVGRHQLVGFEVVDNGVGFDPANYDSFILSDSRHKSARGGKGIGRLLWLKVFKKAEIDSVYHTPAGLRRRRFRFSLGDQGVGEDQSDQALPKGDAARGTTVRLVDPLPGRDGHLDMDAERLSGRLVEYFFLYFSVFPGVRFDLVDDQAGDRVDLNARYAETVGDRHVKEQLDVKGHRFTLHHLFVAPAGRRNAVHMCAHGRVVTARSLTELLDEVDAQQNVAVGGNFRYHAYVTGEYLDDIVDDERTGLRFPEASLYDAAEVLKRGDLDDALKPRIRSFLHEHLEAIRRRKEQELDNFAAGEQPQFRPFLDLAKRRLDRLPAKPTKRDIELALYEAKIDGREELNDLVRQLEAERPVLGRVSETLGRLMAQFAATANRTNMSALAEYVCARRAVISVFENALGRKDDGTKHYEAVVHDLFLPRFATSSSVPVGPPTRTSGGSTTCG